MGPCRASGLSCPRKKEHLVTSLPTLLGGVLGEKWLLLQDLGSLLSSTFFSLFQLGLGIGHKLGTWGLVVPVSWGVIVQPSGVCAGTLPSWLGSLARETRYIRQYINAYGINMVIHARKGFPGGSVMKNPPADAEAVGSHPGSGRSPRVGSSIPLQYSCLENSTDRGTW